MSRLVAGGLIIDTYGGADAGRAVFLNGFPGAIGPLPAVLFLAELGFQVLAPQYPGSYDSPGELTIGGGADALAAALQDLAAGHATDKETGAIVAPIPVPKVAVAHSFGAHMLFNLLRAHPAIGIERVVLLAPVISYSRAPDFGVREDLVEQVEYVKATRPFTYRIAESTDWQNANAGQYVRDRVGTWAGRALAVIGTDDDTFEPSIFADSFDRCVADGIGGTVSDVVVVEGAGHAMHELLGPPEVRSTALGT